MDRGHPGHHHWHHSTSKQITVLVTNHRWTYRGHPRHHHLHRSTYTHITAMVTNHRMTLVIGQHEHHHQNCCPCVVWTWPLVRLQDVLIEVMAGVIVDYNWVTNTCIIRGKFLYKVEDCKDYLIYSSKILEYYNSLYNPVQSRIYFINNVTDLSPTPNTWVSPW